MTLSQLITMVDTVRPNQYDTASKTAWFNEVEFRIYEEVLNRASGNNVEFKPFDYAVDYDREVYLPSQFTDVYTNYIGAKIDFANAEIERYNNDVASFEGSWSAFASWYRRHNFPKKCNEK